MLEAQPLDFEKPGLAQHYCVECAKYDPLPSFRVVALSHHRRYYETDIALKSHWKTKIHKKRCKLLREPAYTIEESERAAGLGREGKRPSTAAVDVPMTLVAETSVPS
jgi:bud site selection protein 20